MRKIASVALGLATIAAFNVVGVKAMEKEFDLDSFMEEKIGTDMEGYYSFCFDKISDCFELMDKSLTDATGNEYDLGEKWSDTVNATIERFEGMDEEEALDELEKVIDEVPGYEE